ncbi:MAG TPA: 5-formyltetrahydrofolate cyclo-ligase [Anaerolineaceae bacterium]
MAKSGEAGWAGRHSGKDALRQEIWSALASNGIGIGDPYNSIPNFVGADIAADRLAALPLWQAAKVVKCNPDAPQTYVRLHALREGKTLYMAYPRLAVEKCFLELKASDLLARGVALEDAAVWQNAINVGKPVAFEEMQPVDIAVTGCVAVTRAGGRTGKGAGFADIEFGLLRQTGLLGPNVPIVTTIHSTMVVPDERLPLQPHDTFLTLIVTEKEVIETHVAGQQPTGIDWDQIQPDQFDTIPVLRRLYAERGR